MRFLQIGGNDGVLADPILRWHQREPWHGTIVEPVPTYFQKLSSLHLANSRLRIRNCGVSDRSGELTFWFLDPEKSACYPSWAQGLASLDRDHLLRHGVALEDCISSTAQCVTPEDLCRAEGICALDLLCIDVEGHELSILSAFPFRKIPVTLTIFEAWHMSAPARKILQELLEVQYMIAFFLGEDGIIVHKKDAIRASILENLSIFLAKFDRKLTIAP